MNPIWGQIAGVMIVLMLVSFIATWIWLWNSKHKKKFDALARLPLEDEDDQP